MPFARLFLAAAAALVLGPVAASAQTIINSVPYTIGASGKYQLGANLITASISDSAITISAPNVILDLNGFFVSGPGSTASSASIISVGNVSNVTIRNGTVANGAFGINFTTGANSINHLVENVNITRCFLYGVNFSSDSPGSIIRSNTLSQIGNSASANTLVYGIYARGGVRIENTSISGVTATGAGSSYGIYAEAGSFMIGNTISNSQFGIYAVSGGKYLNNLTSGCTTPFFGGTNATGNN